MSVNPETAVTLEIRGKVAIIMLDNEKSLNAMTGDSYYRLSQLLREVAKRDDVYITVLSGKGRFFSAGADVTVPRESPQDEDTYRYWLKSDANNIDFTQAFYSHPKILVTALNGPAVGLSAAMVAHSDFIYAAPHAFLLTPFSSLGLVAEGNASRTFVQRMGIAKANEALIMSKRITAEELVQCGFVNKIFNTKPTEQQKFLDLVLQEVQDRMGDHLNSDSLIKIKALIRKPESDIMDSQSVAEALATFDRFVAGVPQEEFRKIASGKKKHKL